MVVAVDTGVDIDMFVQCHACGLIGILRLLSSVRIHHGAIDWYMLPVGRYHRCCFCFTGLTLPVSDLDYGTWYSIYFGTVQLSLFVSTVIGQNNGELDFIVWEWKFQVW
jgi:hypothetical protein